MKKKCLVLSLLVALFTAFAATNLNAQCPAPYCFEAGGYRVEVANPSGTPITSGGDFPVIVNGDSVFTYAITKTSGKSLNHLDLLIPPCMVAPGSPGSPTCVPPCTGNPTATLYGPGLGDPNTGFGIGMTNYQAYVFNYSGPSGKVSFTVSGRVFALPNAMLLNRGTGNYAYGQILSPACSASCDQFSPSAPLTTNKVVQFGPMYICFKSPDQSGCPTEIYSCCTTWTEIDPETGQPMCLGYSPDPCNCAAENKQSFKAVDFSVGGGPSAHHFMEVWTESDPQCPITIGAVASCPAKIPVYMGGRYMGMTNVYTVPPATPPCP